MQAALKVCGGGKNQFFLSFASASVIKYLQKDFAKR
jgi:hypothetical protein